MRLCVEVEGHCEIDSVESKEDVAWGGCYHTSAKDRCLAFSETEM